MVLSFHGTVIVKTAFLNCCAFSGLTLLLTTGISNSWAQDLGQNMCLLGIWFWSHSLAATCRVDYSSQLVPFWILEQSRIHQNVKGSLLYFNLQARKKVRYPSAQQERCSLQRGTQISNTKYNTKRSKHK